MLASLVSAALPVFAKAARSCPARGFPAAAIAAWPVTAIRPLARLVAASALPVPASAITTIGMVLAIIAPASVVAVTPVIVPPPMAITAVAVAPMVTIAGMPVAAMVTVTIAQLEIAVAVVAIIGA